MNSDCGRVAGPESPWPRQSLAAATLPLTPRHPPDPALSSTARLPHSQAPITFATTLPQNRSARGGGEKQQKNKHRPARHTGISRLRLATASRISPGTSPVARPSSCGVRHFRACAQCPGQSECPGHGDRLAAAAGFCVGWPPLEPLRSPGDPRTGTSLRSSPNHPTANLTEIQVASILIQNESYAKCQIKQQIKTTGSRS